MSLPPEATIFWEWIYILLQGPVDNKLGPFYYEALASSLYK